MSDLEENEVKPGPAVAPPVTEEAALAPALAVPANPPVAKKGLWAWVRSAPMAPSLNGNRLHPIRGSLIALGGGLLAFVLMALEAQFRWGVPLGILGVFLAAIGILDFMGTFDDPDDRVAKQVTLGEIKRPLVAALLSLTVTLLFIGLASAGRLPLAAAAVLITASFLALVGAVFQTGVALGPWALDETGQARPLVKREGFWVVVTGTLLYLPMQGSYSLSDPWETHYGEVAREMLSRNDWISTWWAQDGWFWSKPVLDFWMQAVAMGIFGVNYRPGQMLIGSGGRTTWPEWAVRMPVFILAILALYILYKGVAKVFGRRAGMLGAIVLATMPQWYLLAHQTITDMPLVAALSMSMGLLMLGMHTDAEQQVHAYEVSLFGKRIRLTGFHLVFGMVLLSALPQILYLCSRNIELQWLPKQPGFRWHLDEFWSGSKGNCGLPGNEACNAQKPVNVDFQPIKQAAMWAGLITGILYVNWGERRLQRLYFLAAWYFAAVATMGKGVAGFGLPILVTLSYIAATRKWSKLLVLEIPSGLLLIAAVAIPWYLAMYIRHGQPFTDRLIFHDMYKRAMTHVHDTNEGDDVSFRFFIWQLGYAFFPWTGLVPAGLVWWTRRRDDAGGGQGDVSVFLAMWFVFAFALFTAMLTKFHHYIFPALPPAAMLTGVLIDRMLGGGCVAKAGRTPLRIGSLDLGSVPNYGAYLVGLGVASLSLVYGFIRAFPGWVDGNVPDATTGSSALRPPSSTLASVLIALGVALAIFCAGKFGRPADEPSAETPEEARTRRHEQLMLGGVAIAAAIVVGLVGRDLSAKGEMSDVPGQSRLIHLFTYNYRRPWPDTLDWSGLLAGFGVCCTVLCLFLMIARLRRHVMVMLLATSLIWAVWGLDVYLVKAAPHWGQREVIAAYYKMRGRPEEPIVAYQMNWKGENFYTGNQTPAFVSSGAPFTTYLRQQQDKGIKTFWFVTEHSRTSALKNEAGNPKTFDIVTDKRLNNKFCLVKASFD
ncbi:MAG TPA: glycosyltransferase family 39 protein [Polyangiaceae bacterium]|nr:glycosyltransferase family 39 protein [Polyangiaceae bacterium]